MPHLADAHTGQTRFLDPDGYAEALAIRARHRLDPHMLHSWMVQRLVVDLALEHDRAVQVSDALFAREGRRFHAH